MNPFLKSLKIKNLLSFGGGEGFSLDLKPLNILIGANGSGKSNLIQIFKLLKAGNNNDLLNFIMSNGGGSQEWLWKKANKDCHVAEIICEYNQWLGEENSNKFVPFEILFSGGSRVSGRIVLSEPDKAVLTFYGDWPSNDEIIVFENFDLKNCYNSKTDQPPNFLSEDGNNLGLILHNAEHEGWKKEIISELKKFNDSIVDYHTLVYLNSIVLFIHEQKGGELVKIPLLRVSAGTVRYLCLLSILLHPKPPPLICIEEPELGLHPDIIIELGRLLKEASQRTQLIITTHSRTLVDCFSDDPESVVVCEQGEQGETKMKRLVSEDLKAWLEKYSLGELWSSGEIGGNRW